MRSPTRSAKTSPVPEIITCPECGQPVPESALEELKLQYPPAEGPAADIPANLWELLIEHRGLARHHDEIAKAAEKTIREIAGAASRLKVNGRVVARRITQDVSGASWRKDYYRQTGVTPRGDG